EPRIGEVLDQIDYAEEVTFARYWDVVMHQWHEGAVVCLGDAAHATSPQLGQGANLALVDAAVLADAISGSHNVRDALDRYSSGRRSHLGYSQWATRILTPFFQSDFEPFSWPRDAFMGYVCRMPYVRTRMIRTMCG